MRYGENGAIFQKLAFWAKKVKGMSDHKYDNHLRWLGLVSQVGAPLAQQGAIPEATLYALWLSAFESDKYLDVLAYLQASPIVTSFDHGQAQHHMNLILGYVYEDDVYNESEESMREWFVKMEWDKAERDFDIALEKLPIIAGKRPRSRYSTVRYLSFLFHHVQYLLIATFTYPKGLPPHSSFNPSNSHLPTSPLSSAISSNHVRRPL